MITAILIAFNEEKNLKPWLEQMAWCDERLVIDNESTDNTAQIAKDAGAKVISAKGRNFASLRNMAVKHASHEWLLYVDADEVVTPALVAEIQRATESSLYKAYRLRREDVFWNTNLHFGEVRNAFKKGIIRLVHKGSGTWNGAVHETFQLTSGTAQTLDTPLKHVAHAGIKDFLESINMYSTLRAEELYAQKVTVGFLDLTIRPCIKFIYTYFLQLGFCDGPAGFVYAFMMSFHSFLVRAKLYMLHAGVTQPQSGVRA